MSPALLCSGIAMWIALVAPAGGAEPAVATAAAISPQQSEDRHAGKPPVDDALDRISLDSTAITGNRELPKVMSIVPWKSAEPPDGPDRPMGSLIEEMLAPVDRDEFRREITYYHGLTSQSRAGDARAAERSTASGTPERQRSTTSSPTGAPSQ
jgi:hypothetical protein